VASSALPEETFQQRRAESEPMAARPPVELAPRPEPRRQTTVPPWLTRLTTLMLAVAAVVTLAAAVASVPPMSHHVGTVARAGRYDTVYALAVPLLVLRAVFVPAQRGTWAQLRSWGCDQVQGYHISRPVPAGPLCDWLTGHRPAAWIGSSG
jgi:hypothetical protein